MNIPGNAKKVFQGVIYSVYQWDQERFDGSHATYEMISRPHSAMIIPTREDKILLAHEEQPGIGSFYSLFGGQIDKDEDPEKAAKRELLEESGYASDDLELFQTYFPIGKSDWRMYLFIARNCKKEAEQKPDPGEKIEVMEVDFDRFIEIAQSKEFRVKDVSLELFRMEKAGKLEEFKQLLFKQ